MFKRIGIAEAREILARRDGIVLDTRDARSFAEGHIDTARNISASDIPAIISTVARPTPLLVCCYHGNASQDYAQIFCDFGFLEVYSLDGGYAAWAAAHS